MPPQPVLDTGALADEVLAMVKQQLDLERLLVQPGARQRVDTFTNGCPSDAESVDVIRLAALARDAASARHQLRRDTNDPLPSCEQEPLKPSRDVTAVLDREDSITAELSRPADEVGMTAIPGPDGL